MKASAALRPAGPQDLDRILEMEPVLFGADSWSRSTYEAELTWPGRHYVVVTVEDQVVGYAGIDLSPEATVMTVGVAPQFRRQGLGRRLMDQILDTARQAGCREVHLEVRADDAGAQALYTGLGFERIGRRRRYYRSDGADAVIMRLRWNRQGPLGSTGSRKIEEST